jgi:hypothetical protein
MLRRGFKSTLSAYREIWQTNLTAWLLETRVGLELALMLFNK